jgi:molecular chaperone DnaK (HSP70)
MDKRGMLQRHLALAETHVIQGEQHIAKQKRILAEMECAGHEKASRQARELLATFELTHTSHVEDRDRIQAELAWPEQVT